MFHCPPLPGDSVRKIRPEDDIPPLRHLHAFMTGRPADGGTRSVRVYGAVPESGTG